MNKLNKSAMPLSSACAAAPAIHEQECQRSSMRKIIVKATREAAVSALGHDYCAYFEGQEDANRYGYGETPQKAKRELLLSQEVMETSKGASISVWTTSGHVKVWAYTNEGRPLCVALRPQEVRAFIEQLQLARQAV